MQLEVGQIYYTRNGTVKLVKEAEAKGQYFGERYVILDPIDYDTKGLYLNSDGTFNVPRKTFELVVQQMTRLQMIAN